MNAEDVSTTNQMVWNSKTNGWGQGDLSTSPDNSNVGSFDALDSVLSFFHNKSQFPALTSVVLAGFSMGGQLVQRYSVFRSDTSEDDRTKYWVSSPASYVYFNESRPSSTSSCPGFNDYKVSGRHLDTQQSCFRLMFKSSFAVRPGRYATSIFAERGWKARH